MRSEKMDRMISLIRRNQSRNSYGEVIYSDSVIANVYANVTPVGGRETFMASQMVPEAKYKMLIRYRSDLDTSCKIVFETVEYDIAFIGEISRRDGLEIWVKLP
jgi:SPP1 family predicted phage head-tail adaptor